MTSYFIQAYAALSLGFWFHTLYRMATSTRGRERLFGVEERIILGIVALATSAGWIVLLPIYGLGRLQLAAERGASSAPSTSCFALATTSSRARCASAICS